MKDKWLKCSAVRILNGKLQIRNPEGFWGALFQQKSGGASKKFNKQYTSSYFDKDGPKLTEAQKRAAQKADSAFAATAGKVPRIAKLPKLGLTKEDGEVVQALVGQGAGKSQAKLAVQAAKARGASGFDGIFRGALKELT